MSAVVPLKKSKKAVGGAPEVRAFILDDETRAAVAAATSVRYPEARIYDGGISAAMSNLSQEAQPTHVIIDVSDAEDPAAAIRLLLTVCSPDIHIIALGTVNDVPFYQALIEAGASDYLLKPLEPEGLRQSLERLSKVAESSDHKKGTLRTVAVVGVRGGVGASTVAVNIAWHAAHDLGRQCALLDLDIHFGTVTLALDLEPCGGMREILENPGRVDGLFISSSMVRESENLLVLGSEESLEHELTVDPAAISALLDGLDKSVEFAFLDMPRSLIVTNPGILRKLDCVVLVVDPSLAGVRDTTRMVEFIRNVCPEIEVVITANKIGANRKGELPIAEFKRNITLPVDHTIPWDAKVPAEAGSAGKSLAAIGKNSPIVAAVNKLSETVAPVESSESSAQRLSKWFRKKQ